MKNNFTDKNYIGFILPIFIVFFWGGMSAHAVEVDVKKGPITVKLDKNDIKNIETTVRTTLNDWLGLNLAKCHNRKPDQYRGFLFVTEKNITAELTNSLHNITHNCMYGSILDLSEEDKKKYEQINLSGMTLGWNHKKKHPNLKGQLKLMEENTTNSRVYSIYIAGSDAQGGGNTSLRIHLDGKEVYYSGRNEINDIVLLRFDGLNFYKAELAKY